MIENGRLKKLRKRSRQELDFIEKLPFYKRIFLKKDKQYWQNINNDAHFKIEINEIEEMIRSVPLVLIDIKE